MDYLRKPVTQNKSYGDGKWVHMVCSKFRNDHLSREHRLEVFCTTVQ